MRTRVHQQDEVQGDRSSKAGGRGAASPSTHTAHNLMSASVDGVQMEREPAQEDAELTGEQVHELSEQGISGGGGNLPGAEQIQESFGHHDVSGITAHTGAKAEDASRQMGATAYTKGSHVALGSGSDLHTVAHEAAHAVQQQAGVSLPDGVGKAGDRYETHADAVADRVVAGQSAEPLLDTMAGSGSGAATGQEVQLREGPPGGPGKTGGKVTHGDFAREAGVTDEDVAQAGAAVEAENQKSLTEMQAMLGGPASELAPRSTKEMLAAIQSGVMPRWVARVGPLAGFTSGQFGFARAGQIFATEPKDVVGLNAAEALVKVGWTPAQAEKNIGEDIGLCILDTDKALDTDGGTGEKPSVGKIDWSTLEEASRDPAKNAYFLDVLRDTTGPLGSMITEADLPALFKLASETPVGATPNTTDETLLDQYDAFREALSNGLSASELYSGMEATVSERGEVGAREVAVSNDGSNFKVKDGVNCTIKSLGKLTREQLTPLMS